MKEDKFKKWQKYKVLKKKRDLQKQDRFSETAEETGADQG